MDWAPGYRELASPPELRPSVSCVWARVARPDKAAAVPVLPDACIDLIWQQGHGVFVAGPDTGPAPSVSPPGTVLAGVRFAPGSGGPALRLPLSELLDQRVDAADLATGPAAGLARVDGALTPEEALRLLTRLAAEMVADGPADPLVTQAVRLLGPSTGRFHSGQLPGGPAGSAGDPAAQAEAVADRLGMSERQLRRRCQAAVGYGPATLRRVLRFRQFLSWADAQPAQQNANQAVKVDLATVATELGYADQAHLTRESVRLAGLTPAALVQSRRPGPR
jgi:AraC-like DNA-binding protein